MAHHAAHDGAALLAVTPAVVYVDPPAHDLTPHDPERFRTILTARIAHGALPLPEVSA
ncbi:hypothetical protein [Halomonas sp. PA16-9]|uniref:hypothetical protein n=1 Tax=Halomonas sp. PA16-9 TaxID=2576841 RepID=UPI0012DAC4BD